MIDSIGWNFITQEKGVNMKKEEEYVGEETKDFVRMAELYDVEHEGEKIMGIYWNKEGDLDGFFKYEQELKYLALFVLGFCIGYWSG